MTLFEGLALLVAALGVGVPAWIYALGMREAMNKSGRAVESNRFFAYARLLGYLHNEMKSGKVDCGPVWIAAVRELTEYPEYADLSVLFLEEISVTGEGKFDRITGNALKETESRLLSLNHA